MKERIKKTSSKKTKARKKDDPRQFETMSQVQNRYGKGRERNGSDGGSTQGRGSNH